LDDPAVPPDALARLEVPVTTGLAMVPSGPDVSAGFHHQRRATVLASVLAHDHRTVVVDAGLVRPSPGTACSSAARPLAAASSESLLVLRPCYLALRRAAVAPVLPSGVVLVREPGRSLSMADVASVLSVPVRAVVDWDPAIARAVDAGLLASRMPRSLTRALVRSVRWVA
jgi:hypothetical protein